VAAPLGEASGGGGGVGNVVLKLGRILSPVHMFVLTQTEKLNAMGLFRRLCQIALNPLNAELNPICHLLELLGAHYILHVSRIRVKLLPRRS